MTMKSLSYIYTKVPLELNYKEKRVYDYKLSFEVDIPCWE